jgi:uncharacterized membrane protein YtjA (UPF0391 family)
MLCWVFVFLGTAIIVSLRGLGGLASTASGIAQLLFFAFLVAFLVALVTGSVHRQPAGHAAAGEPEDVPEDPTEGPVVVDSPIAGRTPLDRGGARPRRAA